MDGTYSYMTISCIVQNDIEMIYSKEKVLITLHYIALPNQYLGLLVTVEGQRWRVMILSSSSIHSGGY